MFEKILVPLDGSELGEAALPFAEHLTQDVGGELTLISVGEPTTQQLGTDPEHRAYLDQVIARMELDIKDYLSSVAQKIKAKGLKVRTVVMVGKPAEEIIDYAHRQQMDMIAMATHGRSGIGRWVYGSVAEKVLRGARVPILLVRSPGAPKGPADLS